MGQRNTDTAVLIFSLSARREAERKELFGGARKQSANKFFDILIGRTKELAYASGIDTFFIDERRQKGCTFGERYANAFQEIFAKGYSNVISIGNDTPDLTADILRKAIDEIQQNHLVIGPSTDGGVYLLGINRSLFNIDEFSNLPWLKDSLSSTLFESAFWQQGGSSSLDRLSDIDDTASLLQFVQTASEAYLLQFILWHLFHVEVLIAYGVVISVYNIYLPNLSLRGPPLLSDFIRRMPIAA